MPKKRQATERPGGIDLVPADTTGLVLDVDDSLIEERVKAYRKDIKKKMREAGTLTSVDCFYLERVTECFRVYEGIRQKIGCKYTETGRFGEDKPHHLLAELRTWGKQLDDLLKEGGLTPRSRRLANATVPIVPHGNSPESSILDLLQGGNE